jgi:hypothetical protein
MARTAAESQARLAGQAIRVTGRNRSCAMADVNLLSPAREASVFLSSNRTYEPRPAYQWTARRIAWTLWQGWWLAIWLASLWMWLAVLEGMAR